MKTALTVAALFVFVRMFATGQVGDRIVYEGDSLLLYSNPLELLYAKRSSRPRIFQGKEACITTACWRGYIAHWIIEDDQLFLTNIVSCCYSNDGIKADLKTLFGDKYIDGKVKADWVTDELIVPFGRLLYYIHDAYMSAYEKESVLLFRNGKLIKARTYNNSKSKKSEFSHDFEKWKEWVYGHIDWEKLPISDDDNIKVTVTFSANEDGRIDSVKVLQGYDKLFDDEAVRAVKSIPEWDVYYRRGENIRRNWTFPVRFNKKNKETYGIHSDFGH